MKLLDTIKKGTDDVQDTVGRFAETYPAFMRNGDGVLHRAELLLVDDPSRDAPQFHVNGLRKELGKTDDEKWDGRLVEWASGVMKAKLKASREKGRGGWYDWDECSEEYLMELLREHMKRVDNGESAQLIDVAILAMMVRFRNEVSCPGCFAGID